MKYSELEVGMKLVNHLANGEKRNMLVIRKGVDGFGEKSVVLQSTTSLAQFYIKEASIPLWYLSKA